MKIILLNKGAFAFIFGLLLCCGQMNANYLAPAYKATNLQSTVTGTVSDASGPLPGVTIILKGTNTVAVTDDSGRYSIAANSGDILVFSFVGFIEQEQIVTGAVVNVVLQEDLQQLQEVVINAGYYTVKDKERTGSISRITSKEIENQPVANVLGTMQGRMAGVDIVQNTGVPGGGFNIRIRGTNSLRATGNNPLYVIDGVPYSAEPIGYGSASIVLPGPVSPLNSINPAEIESIEVLKDADATAIYGSRGANGVVLVTTKRGKSGKATYSVGYSRGYGRVTRLMDMLNTQQYFEMREEAFQNDGIEPGPMDYDVNGTWQRDRYTDWQKEFLGGTADITNVTASASGGSETTRYLLSSNYYKETTVFPGDYAYDRINTRFQMNHESNDKRFKANVTAGYSVQRNGQPATDPTLIITMLPPNAPALRDEQGNINWENSSWTNPLGDLKARYSSKTYDAIANAMLSYNLFTGFDAKVSLGYSDTRLNEARTQPSDMYDPAYQTGPEFSIIDANATTRQSYIIEPQLTYSKQWDKARLETLIDAETGLYQFKDFNNDGVITAEDDMQAVVDLNPSYFGGIANQLTYKGFALDFHFQFVKQDNYNETATTGIPGMAYNQPASVMDRWQQPGDNARFQRFTTGVDSEAVTAASQFAASTGSISDASYIRLKNIALSYTLPKEWLGGVGCRINVEAQNLVTITSFKGRDPEFGATNFLPPLKIITTGIQLNF